jgi:hypothetical protein
MKALVRSTSRDRMADSRLMRLIPVNQQTTLFITYVG